MNKNVDDLERFVEKASISNKFIQKVDSITLQESLKRIPSKLKESVNSSESPDGYWVPISFYNKKNGNGRIYNKRLWQNVINNQKDTYVGSAMLMDHPSGDSDGNPRDICGVWLDCKLGPEDSNGIGLVYGLLVPCGRQGEDLKDGLKKGLKIGTSSSGFGKLMGDNMTVNPDTYMIERLADYVLNPSQGTFFAYDESGDIEDRSIREASENSENTLTENIKEKVVEDSRISKLEEKKFRRDMESFLKEADNIKDPQEKLEEFKEIKSFLQEGICSDLKEQIENKIALQEAEIKRMLQENIEMKEEFGIESPKDLKEKLTKISEDVDLLTKESKDWKAISEQLQTKYNSLKEEFDKKPSNEYVSYLKEKINKLTEEVENSQKLNESLKEDESKVQSDVRNANHIINSLKRANNGLKNSLKESNNTATKLQESVKTAEENNQNTLTSFNESKDTIAKLTQIITEQRAKIEEATKKIEDLEILAEKRQNECKVLAEESSRVQHELARRRFAELREQKAPKTAVESYYNQLYEEYGNEMKPFEENIKSCRTLEEAKNVFFRKVLQNLNESKEVDDARIPNLPYVEAEDRINSIGAEKFYKTGITDRMPKGWQ